MSSVLSMRWDSSICSWSRTGRKNSELGDGFVAFRAMIEVGAAGDSSLSGCRIFLDFDEAVLT